MWTHVAPGLVVSPYAKREFVDFTLYTTSAMLRTMELLLGLPPMTQYDAAALPMYNAFNIEADLTPYKAIAPKIDVTEKEHAGLVGRQGIDRGESG